MKLKVLFVAFLFLFGASIICNVAMVTLNAPQEWSFKAFARSVHTDYLTTNGTEPTGDPIDGPDDWPM